MDVDLARLPGGWLLRRKVLAACGPGARFAELGHLFGDWLQSGRDAPYGTWVVEEHIAGYLEAAADTGRRWGFRAGLVGGLAIVAVTLVLALLTWWITG